MAMEDSLSTQLVKVPKIEFDSIHCYYQDPFDQNTAFSPYIPQPEDFLDSNSLPLQCNQNQIPQMGFQDCQEVGSWDFMLDNAALPLPSPYDYVVLDEKPVNTMVEDPFDYYSSSSLTSDVDEVSRMIQWGLQSWTKHEEDGSRTIISNEINDNYKKCGALEFDEIKKYFELPITEAAKELKVGVTLLKRRCRELNIVRWPHRKIKSLKALIEHVKGMGLTNEVRMLEEQKRLLKELPDTELTERAKKLRQACFKAKNKMMKKKRSLITASCP